MHPAQFAPGPPIPGMDKNGVPMHGSVPGRAVISWLIVKVSLFIGCLDLEAF